MSEWDLQKIVLNLSRLCEIWTLRWETRWWWRQFWTLNFKIRVSQTRLFFTQVTITFLCWSVVHLFDHLLWSIFQLSITHYINQFLQVLTCFMVTFCGQLSCTASTPVFLMCGHYQAAPFKFKFNQLLIFVENLSPLPGFEPGPSRVPSWYATNSDILASLLRELGSLC